MIKKNMKNQKNTKNQKTAKTLCFHKENAHDVPKPYFFIGMATLPSPVPQKRAPRQFHFVSLTCPITLGPIDHVTGEAVPRHPLEEGRKYRANVLRSAGQKGAPLSPWGRLKKKAPGPYFSEVL